ncbi:hypothetical protein [Nocardiopsis nanhaiensis]
MSTSSDDTAPTPDPSPATETPGSTESPQAPGVDNAASDAFLSGRPAPHPSGLFGPETFSIAGLLLLATTVLSTQLIGIFNQQTLIGAEGTLNTQVQGQLTGAGLFSALAVVCGAIALVRTGESTRPWARHLAAATVLVGVLLVIVTVLSYVVLSAP